MSDIGSKIKNLRLAKGLTLKQLSCESGVSVGYLARLERGERHASGSILANIAKPLGLGEVELLKLAEILSPDASDERLERFKRELKEEIARVLGTLCQRIDGF